MLTELLKKEKYILHVNLEVRKFKIPAQRYCILLAILLTMVLLLCFAYRNHEFSYLKILIDSIDNILSSTQQWIFRIGISLFILSRIIGLVRASYNRLDKSRI